MLPLQMLHTHDSNGRPQCQHASMHPPAKLFQIVIFLFRVVVLPFALECLMEQLKFHQIKSSTIKNSNVKNLIVHFKYINLKITRWILRFYKQKPSFTRWNKRSKRLNSHSYWDSFLFIFPTLKFKFNSKLIAYANDQLKTYVRITKINKAQTKL